MTNLDHSMVSEPNNPLAVQHAMLLQATMAAKTILDNALKNYKMREKNKSSPTDKLWILHPAIVNATKILDDVLS